MNKTKLIFSFIAVFIIGLIGGGMAWSRLWASNQQCQNKDIASINSEITEDSQADINAVTEEKVMDKEFFSLKYPAEWHETAAPAGITAIVTNNQEELNSPEANFYPYFSVIEDASDKGLPQFVQDYKAEIKKAMPGISFIKEEDIKVNDRDAHTLEAEGMDQNLPIKAMFAIIQGKAKAIWILTFNAPKDSWSANSDTFLRIMNSFRLKD